MLGWVVGAQGRRGCGHGSADAVTATGDVERVFGVYHRLRRRSWPLPTTVANVPGGKKRGEGVRKGEGGGEREKREGGGEKEKTDVDILRPVVLYASLFMSAGLPVMNQSIVLSVVNMPGDLSVVNLPVDPSVDISVDPSVCLSVGLLCSIFFNSPRYVNLFADFLLAYIC